MHIRTNVLVDGIKSGRLCYNKTDTTGQTETLLPLKHSVFPRPSMALCVLTCQVCIL